MARIPVIAGNWKMNTTLAEGVALAGALREGVRGSRGVEVVVAPPLTHLAAVGEAIRGSNIRLAAQNLHASEWGAYTGEVSAPMLKEAGCDYVIIGHSERRQYFGETDRSVNEKALAALAHGLIPIVCVGETLAEREAGETLKVILRQIEGGLKGLPKGEMRGIIVAYEPVWAIGTGKTATDEQAEEVHRFIREKLAVLFDAETSEAVRILYGGSVKPDNVDSLMAKPNIDGALVGGASLKAESFERIVNFRRS